MNYAQEIIMKSDFAVIIPMANEQENFHPFISSLTKVLNILESGKVYFVLDRVCFTG